MKTIYQFLAFIVCLGIISCKKENATQVTLNYTVKVEHPIGYKTVAAANATVKATNSFTGETKTVQTDANGEAHFSNLLPGSYQFAASKTLAAQEANEQTGFDAEIFLNASLNNYAIQETGTVTLQLKGSAVGAGLSNRFTSAGHLIQQTLPMISFMSCIIILPRHCMPIASASVILSVTRTLVQFQNLVVLPTIPNMCISRISLWFLEMGKLSL